MRALLERTPRASVLLVTALCLVVMPGTALGATRTFSYTGAEQTYTVPDGVTTVFVTATGARGGGPTSGTSLLPGAGAVAMGKLTVAPGDTLYVEVGGAGSVPQGGFNGGGNGGDVGYISEAGGGGASDVRTVSRSQTGSLDSRLIVAGGGGGSGYPASSGGNAGQNGGGFPDAAAGGRAGTQLAGGAGGCPTANVGCGLAGALGVGGTGGQSGSGGDAREGGGGGGGRFGGGGGAGVDNALSADVGGGAVGGGGGGSSLVPAGGVQLLASLSDPATVVISTKVPKYTAYTLPVYLCFPIGGLPQGTVVSVVSYLDKGGGDVHLENVPNPDAAVPSAAGTVLAATLSGVTYATFPLDSFGLSPTIEIKGDEVPSAGTSPVADLRVAQDGLPVPPGFVIASSTCTPPTT